MFCLNFPLGRQSTILSRQLAFLGSIFRLKSKYQKSARHFFSINYAYQKCLKYQALALQIKNINFAHKYVDPEFKTFLILRELCVKDTFGVHSKDELRGCISVHPFGLQSRNRLSVRVEIGYLLHTRQATWPRYQGT